MFELDKVELEFTEAALKAVAKKAIERKIGARGLRSIIEETLQKVMYDVPSDYTIEKVIINEDVINGSKQPEFVHDNDRTPLLIKVNSDKLAKKSSSQTSDAS